MTTHTIVHVSDPHLLEDGLLFGSVDCEANLRRFADRVIGAQLQPDAVVITGDIADQAEAGAYRKARSIVDPLARRLGCPVVWVMGNHDRRDRFRGDLLGSMAGDGEPQRSNNYVVEVAGLRIVALDSAVPGYHHGRLGGSTLGWLGEVLRVPAAHGTVLALHHPPLETSVGFLDFLDLRDRADLAAVVRGTDVRAVLAGHWHHPAVGVFAGVPVLVAGATSYSADPGGPPGAFHGLDAAQSFQVVRLDQEAVSCMVISLAAPAPVSVVPAELLAQADSLDPRSRDEAWSRFPVTDLAGVAGP